MTTTVTAVLRMLMTAVETPAAADIASGNGSAITHDGFNVAETPLNVASTPPVTACAYFAKSLAAGVGTIDLTALPGTFGTVDGTGLKVRGVLLVNPSAHAITVQPGAANPHSCFGAASKFIVGAGCACEFWLNDSDSAIGSTSKNWDLSGTGTDSLNVGILLG